MAVDSRIMSLLLDFLKDDDNCDPVEIAITEKVFAVMQENVGIDVVSAMYEKYEKYCEERVGAISDSVLLTGIDICDYGDFFVLF